MDNFASPNPGLVFDLMNSFHKTVALRAGVELGLFAALGEGLSAPEELARGCGATPRGIRILCDYLTIQGLIVKDGEVYRHSRAPTPKAPAWRHVIS